MNFDRETRIPTLEALKVPHIYVETIITMNTTDGFENHGNIFVATQDLPLQHQT